MAGYSEVNSLLIIFVNRLKETYSRWEAIIKLHNKMIVGHFGHFLKLLFDCHCRNFHL